MPFDVERLEITGEPVPVLEGLIGLLPDFAISDNGTLVYVPGSGEPGNRLVWVDRTGETQPVRASGLPFFQATRSPVTSPGFESTIDRPRKLPCFLPRGGSVGKSRKSEVLVSRFLAILAHRPIRRCKMDSRRVLPLLFVALVLLIPANAQAQA